MDIPNIVETRVATLLRDQNLVITITMKNCGMIDEYDIVDLHLAIRHLSEHKAVLKLSILTADWDMTPKAKKQVEKEDSITKTKARAIVVSNQLKASLMNFLRQFSSKSYPQQFFSNRDEAYKWLVSFKEDKYNALLY
jgi:hypothetical protein